MSNLPQTQISSEAIAKVLLHGDLSKLNDQEKISYHAKVCESVGLNPLTQPFAYMKLSGKEVLYAKRDATDQLRRIHNVSIEITSREQFGSIYVVTAKARLPDGRIDESIGAVLNENLKGDALANAFMKAETKAKRRVTLCICGLGMLDETEIETIPLAERQAAIPQSDPENPWDMRIPSAWNSKDAGKTFRELGVDGVSKLVHFLKNKVTNPNDEHKRLLFFAEMALKTSFENMPEASFTDELDDALASK
jgi:hypothetical protein